MQVWSVSGRSLFRRCHTVYLQYVRQWPSLRTPGRRPILPRHLVFLQESRLKRDQFLNQMSSFLEDFESNTADIVPPEPPVPLASVQSSTPLPSRTPNQPRPSPESTIVANVVGKQSLWPKASKDGPHGASLAVPPEASKITHLNSSAAGPGSSLMREDVYGEPMVFNPFRSNYLVTARGTRTILTFGRNYFATGQRSYPFSQRSTLCCRHD